MTTRISWQDDLLQSRDLSQQEIEGFGFLIGWFDSWRVAKQLEVNRESARRFWKELVLQKERDQWQIHQWTEALRWFLNWIELYREAGVKYESLCERLRNAVFNAGARRGLSRNTLKTYAGWVVRYGAKMNDEQAIMNEQNARDWLSQLVIETDISYATQKQALNALAFFYRDVCGRKKVDLHVRTRKRETHIPVVLSKSKIMRLIEKIEPKYRLKAQLQYVAGLRLKELKKLRIKDIDIDRGQLTVRQGKGNRDRVSIIPESLKEALKQQISKCRAFYEDDRANDVAGVHLPNGLARKMSKAGISWEWFWLFLQDHLSRDPESGEMRRHHMIGRVYGSAVKRASASATIAKRVSSHVLRHSFATIC